MRPIFPQLQNLADDASTRAQRAYLFLTLAQLGILVLCAFLSGVTTNDEHKNHILAWSVCALMVLAMSCTTALKVGKYDVRWFKCRAFAENAKSIAWRFVMLDGSDCESNRELYLTEWARLRQRLPELQKEYALATNAGSLITPWMTSSSLLTFSQKIALYRDQRVNDQIRWYARNAKLNARRQSRWFWTMFCIEAAAVFYAAAHAWLLMSLNLTGFIVTLGSGIVAWSQTKRHSDLSTSYAIAAEDLILISAKYPHCKDQDALDEFVDDIEEAVSREHGLWLAKRNC